VRQKLSNGAVIIIGLMSWYFGIAPVTAGTPSDPLGMFVAQILGETEDRWTEIFAAIGRTYHPPKLRLSTGGVDPTPCDFARPVMGPFYCPRDQRVYLDTTFFDDLQNKFGACSSSTACQLSEAYVIAHEIGHHVQDELGILARVAQAKQAASSQAEANQLQVRVELQADCLAGVWLNRAQQRHNLLHQGDIDLALQTASALGDDRLQKEMQGYVVPEAFTHGTSAQRKRWFMNGFNSGQVSACDTMSSDLRREAPM
jgi:predicted metalloprotease